MCLALTYEHKNFKIAEEDIICYKFGHKEKNNPHAKFRTPYMSVVFNIGKTYRSTFDHEIITSDIEKGLHSFADFDSCKTDALCEKNHYSTTHIFKCIIPKGSKYYIGKFTGLPAYASNKLTYVEEICVV